MPPKKQAQAGGSKKAEQKKKEKIIEVRSRPLPHSRARPPRDSGPRRALATCACPPTAVSSARGRWPASHRYSDAPAPPPTRRPGSGLQPWVQLGENRPGPRVLGGCVRRTPAHGLGSGFLEG